jgi:hypothetical protein
VCTPTSWLWADGRPRQLIIFARCVVSDPIRSRHARELAERGLVRLVAAYGDVPEFVLLGGLVPDLLCGNAARRHVGTTDVDVQVDLEIQGGSVNASRLEHALEQARFTPDTSRVWRWKDETAPGMVVKVEFLADLDDIPNQQVVYFDDCEALSAVNLRAPGSLLRTGRSGGSPQTSTSRRPPLRFGLRPCPPTFSPRCMPPMAVRSPRIGTT